MVARERVGERICCVVTGVYENRITLEHDGAPGQLNVPDLTWDERVRARCEDFAEVGASLEVVVMASDGERFSASLKHLQPDPYAGLRGGRRVEGVVHKKLAWGTLVALDLGLVARLEPADGGDLEVGERGVFEITHVDHERRRLRVRRVA